MLHGDTTNIPLTNIFQTLDLNQQEGILSITFDHWERHVAIRRSGISFLTESPYSSQLLQQVLAKLKILTPAEYLNVFSTSTIQTPPGEVLLDRHLITHEQVLGAVREQLLESIYEIFSWRGAQYRFDVQPIGDERLIFAQPELAGALQFAVSGILMEVARREDEWSRIRQLIPSANQIYRITDPDPLKEFVFPQLHPERIEEVVRLLNGQRTVADVLEGTSIPPFFVFGLLRELLVAQLLAPITLTEKKALVARLKLQYPMEKLIGIYQSILDEDPTDLSVRRKLLAHLERNNASAEELTPHYRVLSAQAREKGDLATTREYLRKVLGCDPRDLDSLEQLTLLELESKRDKEWHQTLRQYVEAVRKQREFDRGASFLLDLVDTRPGEVSAIHEAAHLYLLAGKPKDAAATYERAAKLYVGRRNLAQLRSVVEKLEMCDSRAAQRWRKYIVGHGNRSSRWGRLLTRIGVIAVALAVVTASAFAVYEWDARVTYAEVLSNAQERASHGDVAGARSDLEQFRRSYPLSLISRTVIADLHRVENLRHDPIPNPVDPGSVVPSAVNFDRLVEEATQLKQSGDYVGALEKLRQIDLDTGEGIEMWGVKRQIASLETYLTNSRQLHAEAMQAERSGDLARSSRISKRILELYPRSPAAEKVRLPLRIEVLPPDATVEVDGRRIEGPPYLLHILPGQLPRISARAPSFTPHELAIDPQDHWLVRIHLQKRARWIASVGASVESEPLILPDRVVVGTRSGQVVAFSRRNGMKIWEFPLEGLGDPRGAIQEWNGDVVFTGTDHAFYRLRAQDGALVYRLPLPRVSGFTRVPLTPPDSEGRSYILTSKGFLQGVDVEEGKVLWSLPIGGSSGTAPLRIEDLVVATNAEGGVVAIDGARGGELWSRNLPKPLTTRASGNKDQILVACEDHLYSLSTRNGEEQWKIATGAPARGEILLLEERFLYVTDESVLFCCALDDGELQWRTELDGPFDYGPRRSGSQVLLVNRQGTVQACHQETGQQLWKYSSSHEPGCGLRVARDLLIICGMNGRVHAVECRPVDEPGGRSDG